MALTRCLAVLLPKVVPKVVLVQRPGSPVQIDEASQEDLQDSFEEALCEDQMTLTVSVASSGQGS